MGACQNQFHNVPDADDQASEDYAQYNQQQEMLAKARDSQMIRSGSIKQQHKNVRPNSKEIQFGMIDRDRIKSQYLSQVGKVEGFSPTIVKAFSVGAHGQNEQSNNIGLLVESRQLDREQLHQTVRPYKDLEDEEIEIKNEDEEEFRVQERQRKQLRNFDFFYSLALPEYVYPPIPQEYARQYEDLILGEQEERYGVKYIGEWKNDKIHGNGIMQSNTVKYIGQFRKGVKWFHGRQIEQDQVYQGGFLNGRRKGQGIRYTQNSTQEGEFDIYLKQGIINYSNGDSYEGSLQNNKFNGDGKFVEKTKGIIYKGKFRNGKLVDGKIQYQDGRYYEGKLENGLKNGKGYFYWDDQNIYDGEYKNGKKHGEGTLLRNGKKYKGTFENGELKDIVRDDNDMEESNLTNTDGQSLPSNWKQVMG